MTGFYFKETEQKPSQREKSISMPLLSVYVFTYFLDQHWTIAGAWLLSDQSINSRLKWQLGPNSVISVFSTHELFSAVPSSHTARGKAVFPLWWASANEFNLAVGVHGGWLELPVELAVGAGWSQWEGTQQLCTFMPLSPLKLSDE